MTRRLDVTIERWPIRGIFTIARGSKREAVVVVAEIHEGEQMGRGESVPYTRYGEDVDRVVSSVRSMNGQIEDGIDRESLIELLPAGAARNALDCALWDLESKLTGTRAWELANLDPPQSAVTAYTVSLADPETMRVDANRHADWPLLKVKLGRADDLERVRAVREGAPEAVVIVDANEAWSAEEYLEVAPGLAELGVALLEQPLPAGNDDVLAEQERPVPVCADESAHDRSTLEALFGRYDTVNIKLDKTGGLTEALAMVESVLTAGLDVMVGCMVSTSLAVAPATLLTGMASYVDLDGPLLLAEDREPGLTYDSGVIQPPSRELWG